MKIFKIKYIIILLAAQIFVSCNDYLNNQPKGYTIPTYAEDYEKLLNSQGLMSISDGSLELFTDNVHLLDKTQTASYYIFINKSESVRNIYSFKPGQINVLGDKDYIWGNAYSRLFTYNIIINNVMASKGSEQLKLRVKSEALFARAYEYYFLVNTYAKQYNQATAGSDYGVPYIKEGDINQTYKRNTVAEVYQNIIDDLKEAEPNIQNTVPNRSHPNKAAVYSFYAKIYLSMGNYNEALKYANDALTINANLVNLNNYDKKEGTTWGRVHLKGNTSERLPDINSPEANYFKNISGTLQGSVMLSRNMRDLYVKDLNGAKDLRKEYFFAEDQVNLGGSTDYFAGECAFVLYTNTNMGLTSVENYFIAAECEARVGSIERAMQLVNKVRENRLSAISLLTAANKEEALTKVLEEKRREYCMRGPIRLFDLKRLNLEPNRQVTITHSADGEVFTLAPNDNKYIFPINQDILDFNPDMPLYERK